MTSKLAENLLSLKVSQLKSMSEIYLIKIYIAYYCLHSIEYHKLYAISYFSINFPTYINSSDSCFQQEEKKQSI